MALPRTIHATPKEALALLSDEADRLAGLGGRRIIGIAGGPGAGKSTLAQALVARLGSWAAYVPMDGFHLPHKLLKARGQVADKGMPHTFDGAGFAEFLTRLRGETIPVSGPGYSREIEDVVADAFTVPADAMVLVTEGNYLLLPDAPWDAVRPLLDLAVFLDVPRDIVKARLLRRHAEHGLFTEERNRAHVERVDLVNHDRVAGTRHRADLVIEVVTAG
jgi:pantothenate kinase